MKTLDETLKPEIMQLFPSGTAVPTFPEWVANHAGLEQFLCVAGMLNPSFHEVKGLLVWDKRVVDCLDKVEPGTPFGNDPETIERYFNTINLVEFFLMGADEALDREGLVEAFGEVLRYFWSLALKVRFPDRRYRFEIADGLFKEEGPCLTFWQDRR
jgi:hypothetical protein